MRDGTPGGDQKRKGTTQYDVMYYHIHIHIHIPLFRFQILDPTQLTEEERRGDRLLLSIRSRSNGVRVRGNRIVSFTVQLLFLSSSLLLLFFRLRFEGGKGMGSARVRISEL